jgi:hypothetical protein
VGILEICIVIMVLIIGLPLLFRILKGLGPIIAVLIAVAVAVGVVALAFNLIGALISTGFELLFGPLGLLLLGGGLAFFLYRRWQQRQLAPGVVTLDEKKKRTSGTKRLDIGDDGEIVTLDELLDDDDAPKQKRG